MRYDVVVVGAGHAGVEAALAAARMGQRVACVTLRADRAGYLPCNCSIGGPAKGHLAREVDALGGQMGVATDVATTHLRRVGTGRGPAIQTLRAHVCKELYPRTIQAALRAEPHLDLVEAAVTGIQVEGQKVVGLWVGDALVECRAVVLTAGTFLNGVCHEGRTKTAAARRGDAPSTDLAAWLKGLGSRMLRFKTGTPPRVSMRTIRPLQDPGDARRGGGRAVLVPPCAAPRRAPSPPLLADPDDAPHARRRPGHPGRERDVRRADRGDGAALLPER